MLTKHRIVNMFLLIRRRALQWQEKLRGMFVVLYQ
jgi:hypothetical protein